METLRRTSSFSQTGAVVSAGQPESQRLQHLFHLNFLHALHTFLFFSGPRIPAQFFFYLTIVTDLIN